MRPTNNLVSNVYLGSKQPLPRVGDGATLCYYTDRHAATIVKVTRTQVHVQEDRAIRTDGNGMSDAQSYRYEPQPDAPVRIFRMTKSGYRSGGVSLIVGRRMAFHDFSF